MRTVYNCCTSVYMRVYSVVVDFHPQQVGLVSSHIILIYKRLDKRQLIWQLRQLFERGQVVESNISQISNVFLKDF